MAARARDDKKRAAKKGEDAQGKNAGVAPKKGNRSSKNRKPSTSTAKTSSKKNKIAVSTEKAILKKLIDALSVDKGISRSEIRKLIGTDGEVKELVEAFLAREKAIGKGEDPGEDLYRALPANMPIGVYRTTPDGKVVFANQAMATMQGYDSVQEFKKVPVVDMYLKPERRQELSDILTRQGTVTGFEAQIKRKDGKVIWVSASARVIKDGTGNIKYYDGTIEDITERKQIEAELRTSEEKHRLLLNSIRTPVLALNDDMRILYCNSSYAQLVGMPADDLVGKKLLEAFPQFERTESYKAYQKTSKTGQAQEVEGKMGDRFIHAQIYKTPWGVLSIAEDTTARTKAEEELKRRSKELQEREELYRTLVNTAQEAIILASSDEVILFANPSAAQLLGCTQDELVGKSILDFIPSEEEGILRSQTERRTTGESSRYELTIINSSGEHHRMLVNAAPLHDVEGNFYAALGVFTDITDRKRVEDKLRESEELYRTLVDTAQEAIILDDPDENIVFINPTAARLLGYPPEELIGRSLFDFIPPEEVKALRSQTAYRITKQESSRYELTLLHRNGSSRRMLVTGAPVYDAEGKVKATMGVFTDITELSVLGEIGRAISSILDINEIYGVIHEQIKRLINADNFYIAHYDKEADEVSFPYAYEEGRLKQWESRRGGTGMTEYVISSGEAQLIQEDNQAEAEKRGAELIGKASHSWLGVPMIIRNQVVGVMTVQSYDPEIIYTEKHKQFLQTVANQAAQAVENARSYSNLEQRLTELSVYAEISRALSATLELDELMKLLNDQIKRVMYADNFYVASFDEETNMIEFPFYIEGGESMLIPARPFEQGLTEYVISSREPLLIQHENFEQECKTLGIEMVVHGENAPQSWLGVPLISRDKVLGIIAVQSTEESHIFDANHTRILASIANQAAGAFANARAYSRLERRLTELSIFNEVGYALGSTLDLGELLEVIYTQTSRVMDTESFYIALCDEAAGTIEFPLYRKNGKPVEMHTRPFGKGLTEYVIKNRKSLLLRDDVADATIKLGIDRVVTGEEAKCWLGVPMIFQDRVIGVMSVQSTRKAGLYDSDHQRLLSSIANQAAGAVANARGYSELEERLTELSVFNEIGTALGSVLEFDELLNVIYQQTGRVMDTDQFYISLYEEKTNTVEFPLTMEKGRRVTTPPREFGNSISERVITTRSPLLIKRDFRKTLQDIGADIILEEGEAEPLCWLGVPMISADKVVGVMVVQSVDKEEVFDEDDRRILATIASQAAGAIANARAYTQLKQRSDEFQTLFRTSTDLYSTLDSEKVTRIIVENAGELIPSDGCTIFRFDADSEILIPIVTTVKEETEQQMAYQIPLGRGVTGKAAGERRPIIANNVHLDPDAPRVPGTREVPTCLLSVPLMERGELLGCMTLLRMSAEEFTDHDLQVFTLYSRQAAATFANSRLFGQLRELNSNLKRREKELRQLFQISTALASTLDMEEVGILISDRASSLIECDGCTFYRFNAEEEKLVPIASTVEEEYEERMAYHVPLGEGVTGQAAQEREPVLANNVHKDPQAPRVPGTPERPTCLISVPLVARGELIGGITIIRLSEKSFTEHELQIATLYARQAAESFANSSLFSQLNEVYADLKRRSEEMQALLETSSAVASVLDEEEVASLIVERATSIIKADRCTIYRYEAESAELVPQSTTTDIEEDRDNILSYRVKLGEGVTGRAAQELKSLIANNIHTDPKAARIPGTKDRPTCLLCAPLMSRGELLGVMTLTRLSEEAFTEHDLELFTIFARQVADAAANSRLLSKLRELNETLEAKVTERTVDLENAKWELERIHADFKEKVSERLSMIAPVMEKVSIGDFSENIPLPEEEDEFTELFVGLNLMIDDLRFMFEENRRRSEELRKLNENLESIVSQRTQELSESNRQTAAFARELEEVIYVTSHDLKTPLRAISGFSQFLYEDYRDKFDQEGKLYLTRLIDGVKRMDKLLDDLLQISAVTRTERTYERIPADEIIKEALKMVDIDENTDIDYDPDKLPAVLCDQVKMVEVFYNLVSNGLKFNDKPLKQVKITAKSSEGFHEFVVEDNGIGIEKRHYDRIFKIFQRLHQRGEFGGTGVGLSMVKRVIEEHNGRIWVESQVGVGTIFHFTLPESIDEEIMENNPERSA